MTGTPAIGLALSGGGFRATAFGLGCLRALDDRDLLKNVRVVSGISGGALLAAMWAYGPANFSDFDNDTVALLERGLQARLVRRVLSPAHLVRAVPATAVALTPVVRRRVNRAATRTDALRHLLQKSIFADTSLESPTHPGLTTVLSATDLHTTNTVRFSSAGSSCSRYGRIEEPVTVSEAVAASAAFPLLMPALERTYTFTATDGTSSPHRVAMTDGGVYDNLGLSTLLPGRSRSHTSHVYDLDYIVAVDAGRGPPSDSSARFLPFRLKRAFDITYRKTQDGGRGLLHAAATSGQLKGFVHAYLGMNDEHMPVAVANLVTAAQVSHHPTNFRSMTLEQIDALTGRGEQLTSTLVDTYLPDLAR